MPSLKIPSAVNSGVSIFYLKAEYSIMLWPWHVDLVAHDSGSLITANVWQPPCIIYREQPILVVPGLLLGNNRRIQQWPERKHCLNVFG